MFTPAVRPRRRTVGPFTGGRDIDLSLRAAQSLGIVKSGVARVEISATRRQQRAPR
jgi:rare lipoprotein A (peptidoglycan hydrolase)